MNLSVLVIILLFIVNSKLSSTYTYNRVLRVKGVMCPVLFMLTSVQFTNAWFFLQLTIWAREFHLCE